MKSEVSTVISFLQLRSNSTALVRRTVVVTDACKEFSKASWGVVWIREGRVTFESGVFRNVKPNIATLEFDALNYGVRNAPHGAILALVDNSNVVDVIRRGRTSSLPLHQKLKEFRSIRKAGSITDFNILWIPSKWNPADGISRQKPWTASDEAKAKLLADAVQRESFDVSS